MGVNKMRTLDEYMALTYVPVISLDEDMDGNMCYRAEHPELPGCMSHGLTPLEAVKNLVDAKRLYIQTRLELGQNIPDPAISTSGTSFQLSQAIVLASLNLVNFQVPEIPTMPDERLDYETNLPTTYDAMAERAA
jgi:predicted RNase H-like HicB family nuclease